MSRDYTRSVRGKEDVQIWFRRFARWRQTWTRLLGTGGDGGRQDFRDALNLKLPQWTPGAIDLQSALASPQVNIYLLARAHQWYLSQLYDDDPEIRVARTGEKGNEFADFEEVLLNRAADEANLPAEFRNVITDLMWAGYGFVWLGIDTLPTLGAVQEGAKGAGEATEEAMAGAHEPHRAQDHGTIADGMETVTQSPVTGLGLSDEQHLSLLTSAAQHRIMDSEEEREPVLYDTEKGRIFARWSPPGWTYWDPMVLDIRHSRWMARKVVIPYEAAIKMPSLRKARRVELKCQPIYDDPLRQGRNVQLPGMSKTDEDTENGCVVLLEVFDKRYRAHHFLNEQCDEYLEVDENYPYLTKDGRIGVKGYFPCAPVVAIRPPTQDADAAWGLPMLAAGWPQQMEIVKLRSKMLSAAKTTVRPALYHNALPKAVKEAIASGADLNGVEVPTEITDSAGGIANALHFPVMPPVPQDWDKEHALIERDFWLNVGVDPAQITGDTKAQTTATEADIKATASHTQIADVMRQVEGGYAHACEIERSLIRLGYTPEHVAGLVGRKYVEPRTEVDPMTGQPVMKPAVYDEWKEQSDEGDKIRARLAARARDEDPVRVLQLEKALSIAMMPHPLTGMPIAKPDRLVNEMFRALGAGEKEEWSDADKAQFAQQQMMSAMAGAPGGGGAPGEGLSLTQTGNPKPPKSGEGTAGLSRGNINGMARRTS